MRAIALGSARHPKKSQARGSTAQAARPLRANRVILRPAMRSRRPTRPSSAGPLSSWAAGGALRGIAPPSVGAARAQTLVASLLATWIAAASGTAAAAPGQAKRLGGPEPQGPAARSLTALHHNPAMLAGMRGLRFQMGGNLGLDQRWIQREAVDPDGAPTGELGPRTSLLNPTGGYFIGGSLYFEPFAVGIGAYDLGSEIHYSSDPSLRWHLAPEPDRAPLFCGRDDTAACKLNGGAATQRTDVTVAVAWNILANLRIGVGVHLPRLRQRFAYDNSTVLSDHRDEAGPRCNRVENPLCAERLGFNGRTRWLPERDDRPAGFDVALTFGLAFDINDRVTLGLRYRTRPLVRGGELTLAGKAVVCRPEPGGIASDVLPCAVATPIDATVIERASREAALGAAFILGRGRLWHIDTNIYWIDLCNDIVGQGAGVRACADSGTQRISLVGLDRNSVLLPEGARYRGHQDVFGLDAYTTYRARSNLAVVVGGHVSSPVVRRSARSAGNSDGWRAGLTLGMPVRLAQSNLQIVPGYGFDLFVPERTRGTPAFDPLAAAAFADSGGDINSQYADLVLAGRGRPSNAGRYTGAVHTFMLTLRWSERMLGFE
jgi:hypothetical protein